MTRSATATPFVRAAALALAWVPGLAALAQNANNDGDPVVSLDLHPRICSLSTADQRCDAQVRASWEASRALSLCLIVRQRPDVRRCWENYSRGSYTMELAFSSDLTFELREPDLQRVLATSTLRVVREALHYRYRHREPWNIFE